MTYQWAIIGAGPAGIAAVGKLLDSGIRPQDIIWIDPKFTVGDFGTLWRNVPSNTKVQLFQKFFADVQAFQYEENKQRFELNDLEPNKTCKLEFPAQVLQWLTEQLRRKVISKKDSAETIWLTNRCWHIELSSGEVLQTKNIILAIGAAAKQLSYPSLHTIPLEDAMDAQRIHAHIHPNDTIAVFGSSHSAMLALINLVENKVKRIINFYRSPLRYAVYLDHWILFDDTGLKGTTADWAHTYIDGQCPQQLERVYSNEGNIEHYLPHCNKVVYAIGFERRLKPEIKNLINVDYIKECGIIAPGLFGLGIAFPQAHYNPLGMLEYRVGLWKFMDYLNQILPIWLRYGV